MFRKIVCILSAAGVLAVTGIPVRAAGRKGSLRIIPSWCETAVTGGTVTLTPVGKPVPGGYALTDGLADWVIWESETGTEMALNWAMEMSPGEEMTSQVTEGEGAFFQELDAGLYLVSQTEPVQGYAAFHPFLVGLPLEDNWNLTKTADLIALGESPRTGDRPAPIVAAMGISFSVAMLMILMDKYQK